MKAQKIFSYIQVGLYLELKTIGYNSRGEIIASGNKSAIELCLQTPIHISVSAS
jgi:hypothetical protein